MVRIPESCLSENQQAFFQVLDENIKPVGWLYRKAFVEPKNQEISNKMGEDPRIIKNSAWTPNVKDIKSTKLGKDDIFRIGEKDLNVFQRTLLKLTGVVVKKWIVPGKIDQWVTTPINNTISKVEGVASKVVGQVQANKVSEKIKSQIQNAEQSVTSFASKTVYDVVSSLFVESDPDLQKAAYFDQLNQTIHNETDPNRTLLMRKALKECETMKETSHPRLVYSIATLLREIQKNDAQGPTGKAAQEMFDKLNLSVLKGSEEGKTLAIEVELNAFIEEKKLELESGIGLESSKATITPLKLSRGERVKKRGKTRCKESNFGKNVEHVRETLPKQKEALSTIMLDLAENYINSSDEELAKGNIHGAKKELFMASETDRYAVNATDKEETLDKALFIGEKIIEKATNINENKEPFRGDVVDQNTRQSTTWLVENLIQRSDTLGADQADKYLKFIDSMAYESLSAEDKYNIFNVYSALLDETSGERVSLSVDSYEKVLSSVFNFAKKFEGSQNSEDKLIQIGLYELIINCQKDSLMIDRVKSHAKDQFFSRLKEATITSKNTTNEVNSLIQFFRTSFRLVEEKKGTYQAFAVKAIADVLQSAEKSVREHGADFKSEHLQKILQLAGFLIESPVIFDYQLPIASVVERLINTPAMQKLKEDNSKIQLNELDQKYEILTQIEDAEAADQAKKALDKLEDFTIRTQNIFEKLDFQIRKVRGQLTWGESMWNGAMRFVSYVWG